jgi:hypothetical protein
MANTDGAFGFRPISRDGSPYNGATLRCVFAAADATAAFIGDPVILDGSSSEGYPGVSQCAAGEPVFGVVTAFEANPDSLGDQYRKASTKRFCQVTPANGTYFEVQEDGDGTDLLAVEVGLNAGFEVAAGSTTYGISGFELDASDASTTSTLDLQIVALVDRADNQLTGTGNANKSVIVKFNDPQDKPLRTGV